ncbi:MAG: hypothetical protein V4735_02810 [Pseudomonadota bacterium]
MAVDPRQVVDAADTAIKGGGGFLSGIVGSLGGLAKGAAGSVWTGAWLTAAFSAVPLLVPDLYRAVLHAIGGEKLVQKAAADLKENGLPGVFKTTAVAGFGLAALKDGMGGMIDAATSKGTDSAGWGTMLGGGAVIAAASAVAIGVLAQNLKTDTVAVAAPATPPKAPAPLAKS